MKFQLSTQALKLQAADCIIIGMIDKKLSHNGQVLDDSLGDMLSAFLKNTTQLAKEGDCALLHVNAKLKTQNILIINLGSSKNLNADSLNQYLISAATHCHRAHLTSVVYALNDIEGIDQRQTIFSALIALYQAYYRYDRYKTQQKHPAVALKQITVFGTTEQKKSFTLAVNQASAMIHGMNVTMDLANCPPNICHPEYLATQAKQLSKTHSSVKTSVLDHAQLKKMGAGAILAVGQGSPNKPKIICMAYHGGKKSEQPHVLLGKGITFDTGGNDLKQPANMLGMKYDMCGAATVLGVMHAVAELALPLNVIGVIASAENMPGGDAYRPEDIITSLSGKTIEVLNTDAEGRLVLCDALTNIEKFKPKAVIDIATLTGAIMIALGDKASGLFSNNDELADKITHAAQQSRDKVWRLPIWQEYTTQLKSAYADLANIGGPNAGSITAACFLAEFAKAFPWAHLDVAGTASKMSGLDRKATGRPVRLLMEYLLQEAGKA